MAVTTPCGSALRDFRMGPPLPWAPVRGSPSNTGFLDMLGVFAEFETNLRRERQMEGIAQAKSKGVYTGRKPSIDPAEVPAVKN